jgi:hypothetical protein
MISLAVPDAETLGPSAIFAVCLGADSLAQNDLGFFDGLAAFCCAGTRRCVSE